MTKFIYYISGFSPKNTGTFVQTNWELGFSEVHFIAQKYVLKYIGVIV